MVETDVRPLIRRALHAAVDANSSELVAAIQELEQQGWQQSGPLIFEALFNAVDRLPADSAHGPAAVAERTIDRFDDSVVISTDVLEAELRLAFGETDAAREVPRNLGLVHCLVAVGQIVHEGHLSLDQATVHDPPPEAASASRPPAE
ncbi:hypothetical protein CLV30_10672 [Haloactinopolyspora alba]|uniref:Uncharacterized protein n=1 Tax=Haloactinopolyspora alba TaxID=648780 RepID=A0A2P8E3M7_9ACTN|nr:hypothetical protein [Haloactinopolyspora alba]PSL04070.1 hypothetical protein CLV30_10672 [Haloactinopolyspora alba]